MRELLKSARLSGLLKFTSFIGGADIHIGKQTVNLDPENCCYSTYHRTSAHENMYVRERQTTLHLGLLNFCRSARLLTSLFHYYFSYI